MKSNRDKRYKQGTRPELWQPVDPKRKQGRKRPQVKGRGGKSAAADMRGKKGSKRLACKQRWKNLTRKQKICRIAIVAAVVIAVIFLTGWMIWSSMMNRINLIDPDTETVPDEYNIPTESLFHPVPEIKGVTNILLLGIDSRDRESLSERSDAMMILTIDQDNKKIKLASLQRDMLVYLPGKDQPQKINSANVAGGPALAMRVVNETFRLNIKNYVVVNMQALEELIDIVGGVMIDVLPEEVRYVNQGVIDGNRYSSGKEPSEGISGSGLQLLNGRQAVAYSRIRKLDSDYARMGRQRTVMQAMLNSFMQAGVANKTNMIYEGLEFISTNLKQSQIMDLGLKVLPFMNTDIDQLQIPIDGYFREYSGTQWANLCDFNGMIPHLQEFIWGRTFPFDPVKEIAGAPNSSQGIVETTRRPTYQTTTEPSETTTVETTAETTVLDTTVSDTTAATSSTDQTVSGETTTDATTTSASSETTVSEATTATKTDATTTKSSTTKTEAATTTEIVAETTTTTTAPNLDNDNNEPVSAA